MVLGTDDAVQLLVWGAVDNNKDTWTTQARTTATGIAYAELGITTDPASPSTQLTEAVNLLAAGLCQGAPQPQQQAFFTNEGMKLLKAARGDKDLDAEWGETHPIFAD